VTVGVGGNVTLTPGAAPTPAAGSITMNADGTITIAAGTTAGVYTYPYTICEVLNPANCDTATATIVVSAAVIDAVDDGPTTIPSTGATTPSVLTNDTLNGGAVSVGVGGNVTLTPGAGPVTALGSITMNPDGTITIAPDTTAGTYLYPYTICEVLNPTNCNTANATIVVSPRPVVTIGDATTVTEGTALSYPVSLSEASIFDTVITIALSGTATSGVDYTAPTLTVTIPAGQTTVNVLVPTIDDIQNEVSESVVITITAVTSGSVNLGPVLVGTGNILDNDADLIPVANDDVTVFTEGAPVSGTVVGNDTQGNGPSVFSLVTGPTNGSLVFNPDGSFTYTANPGFVGNDSFVYRICDSDSPPDCDEATVTLTVLPQPNKLRLLKEVNPKNVTAGSLVSYTLTIQNIGAIPVIGANVVDTPPQGFNFVPGSVVIIDADNAGTTSGTGPITFSGIDVPVGGTATIRYLLRVSAGLPSGEFVNEATVFQFGVAVSNSASAAVTMAGGTDPLFEQSRIWGKVWDDKDGDGWQDEGEKGIPGVRVATVEGWIAETDSKGRYHFEGITLSNQERGQNVVVKVDKSTIPEGAVFTTENPLLRRVTPAIPVRFDFGVKLPPPPKVVAPEPEPEPMPQAATTIELGAVYFDTDRTTIKSEYTRMLDEIAAQIETAKGGTVVLTGYADMRGSAEYNHDLALRRAQAVLADIASRLGPEAKANLKVEVEAAEMVPGAGK